jgi:type IV pilus assembly protein PilA
MKKNVKETMRDNSGFSLVELVIVIAIMAVLVGVVSPQYFKYVERSREAADLDNYQTIITALQVYASDSQNATALEEGTIVFSNGAYLKKDASNGSTSNAAAVLVNDGIDISKIVMKSTDYKTATLTIKKGTDGVYTITSNVKKLSDALAIGETVTTG